jgi:hypothetical protein
MRATFLFAASIAAFAAGHAAAQSSGREGDAHDHPRAALRSVSYAGSGCPAGSVIADYEPTRSAIKVLFDQFYVEAGPGVPVSASRRNCQILFDLVVPDGWSVAVTGFETINQLAVLDAGATGEWQIATYRQGAPVTARMSALVEGPVARDIVLGGDSATPLWSVCGQTRAMNLSIQARVTVPRGSHARALLTSDSVDDMFGHRYALAWRRCEVAGR